MDSCRSLQQLIASKETLPDHQLLEVGHVDHLQLVGYVKALQLVFLDGRRIDGLPQVLLFRIEVGVSTCRKVRPQSHQPLDALVLPRVVLELPRQRVVEQVGQIVAVARAPHLFAATQDAQVVEVLGVEVEAVQIRRRTASVLQAGQYCAVYWEPEVLVGNHLQYIQYFFKKLFYNK